MLAGVMKISEILAMEISTWKAKLDPVEHPDEIASNVLVLLTEELEERRRAFVDGHPGEHPAQCLIGGDQFFPREECLRERHGIHPGPEFLSFREKQIAFARVGRNVPQRSNDLPIPSV